MSTELSAILQEVAAGNLSPDEATARINALTPAPSQELVPDPAQRLLIKGGGVRLIVLGDPSVKEAVADGPHRMSRDGDTLVISTDTTDGDYSTEAPRSAFLNWLNQVMERVGATVTVRVNPALPLQLLLVGGALELSGINAAASVGVEAGSAKLTSGTGPLKLEVMSGSAKVDWTFSGDSTVRADMGSASVLVRPESDVSITAEASLGQALVKAHDGIRKAPQDMPTTPVAVGAGTGTLHASTRMGSVQVTIG